MNRTILSIVFAFLAHWAVAQQPLAEVRIDSLPRQGFLLDKGWKWHAGDSPNFAKVDFDDSAWESIGPTKNIIDLPQIPLNGQIFWLRNTFSVGQLPSMIMQLEQIGATQIFLNGKQIHAFGNFEKNGIKAITPAYEPLSCPIVSSGRYVLSVRYVCEPNVHYSVGFANTCALFKLQFFSPENWHEFYKWRQYDKDLNIVVSSFFICLCLLFFAFYLFFPDRKINLFFTIYTFLSGIPYFCYGFFHDISQVAPVYWLHNFNIIFGVIGYICIQTALHNQFEQKKGILFWFFVVLGLVSTVLSFFYYWGWQVYGVMVNFLGSFAIMLLGIRGRMAQKTGASIIAIGGGFFFIFWIGFLTTVGKHDVSPFFYALAQISVPIAIAIFVGHDLAQTNTVLQQKLAENESLFAEKQQILATQNETLERQVVERTAELEHKNRDLEIEASLEKVRSRSLSMHYSNEIQDVAYVMYGEFKKLNFQFGACSVYLINGNGDIESWVAGFGDNEYPQSFKVPYFDHPVFKGYIEAFRSGKKYETYLLSEDIKPAYDDQMFHHSEYKNLPENLIQLMRNLPSAVFSMAYNKYGALHWGPGELNADEANIIQRFSAVFEQAYTRFLDLQKAEAQAREAQIEVALERVRSKTMAMHKSDQLASVMSVLCKEILNLGIHHEDMETCYITTFESNNPVGEIWLTTSNGDVIPDSFRIGYNEDYYFKQIFEVWQSGESFFFLHAEGDELRKHFAFLYNSIPATSSIREMRAEDHRQLPTETFNYILYFSQGYLDIVTRIQVPEYQEVFKRFGSALQQAYIRFLDLQKAEAQAREAKIEAALEKVRSTSLAIHQSQELEKVVVVLFDKLSELGVPFDATFIYLFDKTTRNIESWVATNMLPTPIKVNMPYDESVANNPIVVDLWYAIENGADGLNKSYKEKDKDDYYRYEAKHNPSIIPASITDSQLEAESWTTTFASEKNSIVGFDSWSGQLTTTEDFQTLKRFAKVFEQAYIRFLDLQKAEAQAREAKIEAALEKIRSSSLGMHHSVEIKHVVAILFEKLKELDLEFDGGAAIHVFTEGSRNAVIWVISPDLPEPSCINLPYDEKAFENNPIILDVWNAKETGENIYNKTYPFDEKNRYFDYVFKYNDFVTIPKASREFILQADSYTATFIAEKNSLLGANSWTRQIFSDNDIDVLKRITRVFEQAYIRFLDLQKAEVQAREAQIEVALEKIRSRTLAMQRSNELKEIVAMVHEKMKELNVLLGTIAFWFFDKNTMNSTFWVANDLQHEDLVLLPYDEKTFNEDTNYRDGWQARFTGKDLINRHYNQTQIRNYFEYVFANNSLTTIPANVREFILQAESHIVSLFVENNSILCADSWTGQEYSNEMISVLKRTAKVFEQAYVRFLDLQKAEAQAREAQIEAALERVRSRAMAMQTSDEINTVIGKIFMECTALDIQLDSSVIIIYEEQTDDTLWYLTNHEAPDYPARFRVPFNEYPFNKAMLNAWHQKMIDWDYVLDIQEKKEWDKFVFSKTDFVLLPDYIKEVMAAVEQLYIKASFNEYGCLMLTSLTPLNNDHITILPRFSKVFDQTYTRFLDLQKAEAQAREATIEIALEKIRASALVMDSSADFHQVVKTLREQLIYLGQKEWEASVIQFYHPEKGYIESWQIQNIDSDRDTNQIGISRIMFDACRLTKRYLHEYLLPQDEYTIISVGEELEEWKDYLISLSPEVEERVRAAKNEIIYMHHSKFSAGALVMVSQTQPNEESKSLQKRASSVFDLAYTRYLDLQHKEQNAIKLIEEKQKLEVTLSELRSTQAQLIQKEKLASLGELTAGIAHEIQNPLNFVNNFSELSVDLIKELQEERQKIKEERDEALEDELLSDLSQNQAKINQHGKRASSIVKGMLEHSRTSTGERILTDINKLADEYLRLSYHGIRAKDGNFNADYELITDKDLPLINVVPQDIGRVLLNLINNAFWAVKTVKNPLVSVKTEQADNQLIISVNDNGTGMSQDIKAKIFQPFFTTKPTGEGTGLGLSLSYDIITKGHGGTIEVESVEGDGTTFVVKIPI